MHVVHRPHMTKINLKEKIERKTYPKVTAFGGGMLGGQECGALLKSIKALLPGLDVPKSHHIRRGGLHPDTSCANVFDWEQ